MTTFGTKRLMTGDSIGSKVSCDFNLERLLDEIFRNCSKRKKQTTSALKFYPTLEFVSISEIQILIVPIPSVQLLPKKTNFASLRMP